MNSTGATLSGSFSAATAIPTAAAFRYGTSSMLSSYDTIVAAVSATGTAPNISGTFTATLQGLQPSTTYYFAPAVTVAGTGDYAAQSADIVAPTISSFTTAATVQSAMYFADCIEMPAVAQSLPSAKYTSTDTHSAYGDEWYATSTTNQDQTVVTHTFETGSARVRNYSLLYDSSKRCALWVACAFNTGIWANNGVSRTDEWGYDPALTTDIQPNLGNAYNNDSSGNAYSRGHQVSSYNRRTTLSTDRQTFYYSNMTPQNQTLNGGQWATLESAITNNAPSGRDTLYMVTGPIFDSGHTSTTDKSGNSCAVPSRYYKCLMLCSFSTAGVMTSATGVAYLTTGNSAAANTAYDGWRTTIDAVEQLTGFDFFTNVPEALQNAAEQSNVWNEW